LGYRFVVVDGLPAIWSMTVTGCSGFLQLTEADLVATRLIVFDDFRCFARDDPTAIDVGDSD
jgi:hypothetical protein